MNFENVVKMVSELAILKYFPANNESALLAVARLCGEMCRDETEVRWLIDRMTSGLYKEWPGPAEMRACFCFRFRPKDGINAYSSVYPDGLPAKEALLIVGPELKALPPGHAVSADVGVEKAIHIAAQTHRIIHDFGEAHATKEEIDSAPYWLRQMYGLEGK